MIDLLGSLSDAINFFNIKVGSAQINVYGTVDSARNIVMASKANVSMNVSNATMAKAYIPLSFVVAVTSTGIELVGANVKAGGNVTVTAESTDSMKAESTTGKLPVSIAVAVGVNDSHILVSGNTSITAGGNVKLDNKADTTAIAKAGKGALNSDSSAYIAVEVAVQDGYVKVEDTSSITAGGDIDICSNAALKGTASAVSGGGNAADGGSGDGSSDNSTGGGLAGIKDLLKQVGTKLGKSGLNWVMVKLHLAAEFVDSKAYKVNVSSTQHGSVSAPASANGHKAADTATFQEGVKYYKQVKGKYVEDTTVKPVKPSPRSLPIM